MTITKRSFPRGIYCPIITFFSADPAGGIDVEFTAKHVLRLAQNGVMGIVTCGTYGEGVLTTAAERIQLITVIREAFDKNGFSDRVIIAGCSDNSVRAAISNSVDAGKAGADAILCTPPSYFKGAVTDEYLIEYFTTLADSSPIPVLIYNYPGVTAGIDISSEVMIQLGQHPNIIGAKYTCSNVGKLTRVIDSLENHPSRQAQPFITFAGMADVLVATVAVGGTGVIAGPANVVPKTLVKAFELVEAGKYEEAFKAQRNLAHLDNDFLKLGIEGNKIYLQRLYKAPEHITAIRCPKLAASPSQLESLFAVADKYVAEDNKL